MNDDRPRYDPRILVTGATGFLGSYLCRHLLHQGYKNIVALKRDTSSLDLIEEVAEQIQWFNYDIRDVVYLNEVFSGVDWVFHCAGLVSYQPKDKKALQVINVEGTANVVNLCLEFNVKKLLHVSSTAAIGRTKAGKVISEKNKWSKSKQNTNYAISKYLAEQEVWRGIAEGLNAVIINPSVILGSGFWNQGTQKLFKLANSSFSFYPQGKNGFVDVRDAVEFMLLLMQSDIQNERFIINAANLEYSKVLALMANHLNKRAPSIAVNSIVRALSWRIEWLKAKFSGKTPFITKETAQQASHSFAFDNSKSLSAFNFEYRPIETTIKETCAQLMEAEKKDFKAMYLPL